MCKVAEPKCFVFVQLTLPQLYFSSCYITAASYLIRVPGYCKKY